MYMCSLGAVHSYIDSHRNTISVTWEVKGCCNYQCVRTCLEVGDEMKLNHDFFTNITWVYGCYNKHFKGGLHKILQTHIKGTTNSMCMIDITIIQVIHCNNRFVWCDLNIRVKMVIKSTLQSKTTKVTRLLLITTQLNKNWIKIVRTFY